MSQVPRWKAEELEIARLPSVSFRRMRKRKRKVLQIECNATIPEWANRQAYHRGYRRFATDACAAFTIEALPSARASAPACGLIPLMGAVGS